MGLGYTIGCIECVKEEDLDNIENENNNIKGTFFNIHIGGVMLCFCKEQLEKIYGINKKYKRSYRLLSTGDPPDEIYKRIGSATGNENIDKIIYEKISNGYEFTETLGDLPYYCETCKKLCTNFYFQMEKGKDIYTPNYICEKCNNILEVAFPAFAEECSEDFEKINFKINIYEENNLIKLISNGKEKILKCDCCGNEKFSIMECLLTD